MASNSQVVVLPTPPPAPTNAVAETNELRAIKEPVRIPPGWEPVGWALLAIATVLLLVLIVKKLIRPGPPPLPVVIPPHIRARQMLAEALALIGQPKPFCIAVSGVLRTYLEERFSFRAPERTTEEFLTELQQTPLLNGVQKNSLTDFLQRCDLVKFAKYEPTSAELNELHDSAVRLVDETAPVAEPPPLPAGNETPAAA
ncbi:MAG: hypothetical protein HZA89_16780 [Verrucomicrobia bacterium]|nr:hypothetical protein [Verrucomicrobiota bacterium]